MSSKATVPLSVSVVGAGIGGLAVAILLAQSGHKVTAFERRDSNYEIRSTGGISLTYNSTRILESMGLMDDFKDIADRAYPTRMKYDTLEVTARDTNFPPYYMVHRGDIAKMLYGRAIEVGVTVKFLAKVVSIQDSQDQATLQLDDGSQFSSDILIGADGISSQVRHTFLPNVSPRVTPCTVMLVDIPRSTMESNPGATEIYNMPPFQGPWGPGKSIVSWTMSRREVYHLQMCDYIYNTGELYGVHDPPDAPFVTEVNDIASLQAFRDRWADWDPRIRFICKSAKSYTKWKIAELPLLPTYSSPSRRITLVGDAAHAMKPFAGQGANMTIEDCQVLSTLLSLISSKQEIAHAVNVYDQVRIPRIEYLLKIIELNVKIFGMKDIETIRKQDEELTEDERREKAERAEQLKKYGPAAARQWTMNYDSDAEARKAWAEFQSSRATESKI